MKIINAHVDVLVSEEELAHLAFLMAQIGAVKEWHKILEGSTERRADGVVIHNVPVGFMRLLEQMNMVADNADLTTIH